MTTEEILKEIETSVKAANDRGVKDYNAMCLSTVSNQGTPSARIVLFKGIEDSGISFYTNYEGRKAKEISLNSAVSLTFFWSDIDHQIRVEGIAKKLSREHAERYFATRSSESQIGAWASAQSQEISSRAELEASVQKYTNQFIDQEVPCPPHWGGFTIHPARVEFWQGRPGRLHDRIVYTKKESSWTETRLSP